LQELVPPVPAYIGESPERARYVPNQEDAFGSDPERALVTRLGQILGTAHARPRPFEEVSPLPREHFP
jgi:hypothetical protein